MVVADEATATSLEAGLSEDRLLPRELFDARQRGSWAQRTLLVLNFLCLVAAAVMLTGAMRSTYQRDWIVVALVSGVLTVVFLLNVLYIHKTAAAPFAWWRRFVTAWRAAK